MHIDNETQYFGILGYPVGHSKSPWLFNRLFEHFNYNGIYQFIEQKNARPAIEAIRSLNFRGLSVTLPHKHEAIKHVDWVDPLAQELRCINTIYNDNGLLRGYNYDGYGALQGLEKVVPNWPQKKILIIGNGGAARGIAMSMVLLKGIKHLYFLVRNPKNVASLKRSLEKKGTEVSIFNFEHNNKKDSIISQVELDIVINTTPVGMSPQVDKSPFPREAIKSNLIVYDIVYNPRETKLLQEAKLKGARVIYGEDMFIGQAALQFQCWTNINADKALMRQILRKVTT